MSKKKIKAIYENGVFRPIGPMPDYGEGDRVILSISAPVDREAWKEFRGMLSPEEAVEMMRLIREGRRVEGDR